MTRVFSAERLQEAAERKGDSAETVRLSAGRIVGTVRNTQRTVTEVERFLHGDSEKVH